MRATSVGTGLATLVVALSLAACSTSDRAVRDQNQIIAREFLATFESGDTTAIYSLFQPDAIYDDFPDQEEFHGIDQIIGHVLSFESWGTDITMNVNNVYTGPNSAVAEYTLSLVQNRPMDHWVPFGTNRNVMINGVMILQVQGGKISRAAEYWDTAPLVLELGGKIVFPGGAVRQENSQSPDTTSPGGTP